MESALGRDFSEVRIHTNAVAARSAIAVGAQAYTVGNHIVFGPGRDAFESAHGQRLLAHELSHVVQQHGGGRTATSPSGRLSPAPTGTLHKKIQIGAADDPLEHEADLVADHVMRSIEPSHRLPAGGPQPAPRSIRTVPVRSSDTTDDSAAPVSVHTAIGRPGAVLAPSVRGLLEPAFGRQLNDVRIHDDSDAWRSAADIGARAYTVGRDVVFGSGQYNPATNGGLRLLAHEVAHSVQHGGRTAHLARAAISDADCNDPGFLKGAAAQFGEQTQSTPQQKAKMAAREQACKVPTSAACTANGHGRPATALMAILKAEFPARAAAIFGVFVSNDIAEGVEAQEMPCDRATPPVVEGTGRGCVFVRDDLEKQAATYNSGAQTVAGLSRRKWSQGAHATLTHETQHALFDTSAPSFAEGFGYDFRCDHAHIRQARTELAAIISEFKPVHHKALGLPSAERTPELNKAFDSWITNESESIRGNVRAIRCACEPKRANSDIVRIFDFASAGWSDYEKWLYNTTLQDPKWKLDWPVTPPASVPVDEVPSAGAVLDVADLPKANP